MHAPSNVPAIINPPIFSSNDFCHYISSLNIVVSKYGGEKSN